MGVQCAELERLKSAKNQLPNQQPDLEAIRDHLLAGLKVGKQSPEYKRTKAAIVRFVYEVCSPQDRSCRYRKAAGLVLLKYDCWLGL